MILPKLIVGFKYANSFIWNNSCVGDTTQFEYLLPECETVSFIEWTFSDPNSTDTVSNEYNPLHYFANAGKYDIRLVTSYGTSMDTIFKTIEIFDPPSINLGADINATAGDTICISPNSPNTNYSNYLWSNGETSDSICVTNSGIYAVSITDNHNCILSDSINISYAGIISINKKFFTLYPNPATNQIQITSEELITKIEVYNQTSTLVKALGCNSKQQTINVSDLKSGSYFIKAFGENNHRLKRDKMVWVEKFVVLRN